jgi:hypothetical protein
VLVGHFDFRNLAADIVIDLVPELSGVGLRLGNGRPVVSDMFVLAGDLTVVASITDIIINN